MRKSKVIGSGRYVKDFYNDILFGIFLTVSIVITTGFVVVWLVHSVWVP